MRHAAAFACALLAACASPPPRAPAVQDSNFDAVRTITGQPRRASDDARGVHTFQLRAFVDKRTRAVTWQLYVTLHYTGQGWRVYDSASLSDGTQAPAKRITTDVSCTTSFCSYTEVIGVPLQADRIAAAPLTVRLNAKQGMPVFVTIPADYAAELAHATTQP